MFRFCLQIYGLVTLAICGTGTGTRTDSWTNRLYGFMLLCRTFRTAPKQEQGLTPIVLHVLVTGHCPGTGHSECEYTISAPNDASLVKKKWF